MVAQKNKLKVNLKSKNGQKLKNVCKRCIKTFKYFQLACLTRN